MRLFTALPLPQSMREHLSTLSQTSPFKARWEPLENIHLTLRFMGEVNEDTYTRYVTALKTVNAPAFSLVLHGVGVFPSESNRPPRVLLVRVVPCPELTDLYQAVSSVLEANGLARDAYDSYTPHVTLARFKEEVDAETLSHVLMQHASFQTEPLLIEAFGLYQSVHTAQGSRYQERERFTLHQGA